MQKAAGDDEEAALTVFANGEPVRLPATATVSDLVARLALEGRRYAVERNGRIVPRAEHAATRLSHGDRLEIVHAVGGG